MKRIYSFLVLGPLLLITSCGSKKVIVQPPVVEQYVVYAPGENLTALTKVTEGEYKCDYPFGGDKGKSLFFAVHTQGDGSSNIFMKGDPFSASMSQNTSGNNNNLAPSFSPATNMVAFAGRFGNTGTHDIYMINVTQGSALIQVTSTSNEEENYPCISQDGTKVVYEKCPANSSSVNSEIWIKNIKTNENTMLGLGRMPSFSKDGKNIVFVKYTPDGWNTCIWTMSAEGKNQMQITNANLGVVWHPRFSPDGNKIIFQYSKPQKKDFDLYVIDKNGNNLTQLTINSSYDGEPYWADDNNIYFTSDRGSTDKHYQIWRFRYGSYPPPPPPPTKHTVKQGETISQIAKQYGITVRDIVQWNSLTTMTLTPGMKLKVSKQ